MIILFQNILREVGLSNVFRSVIEKFNRKYLLKRGALPSSRLEYINAYKEFFENPPRKHKDIAKKIGDELYLIRKSRNVTALAAELCDIHQITSKMIHDFDSLVFKLTDTDIAQMALKLPVCDAQQKKLLVCLKKYAN